MTVPTMSLHDAACALAVSIWCAATISLGCASHQLPPSPYAMHPGDENAAVLIIWPGEDSQAQIVSFDGVPFDAFVGSRVKPGHFRVQVAPGTHDVRMVVPGPCTYYDGRPGPGSSISSMRFVAKAGAQYELRLDSRPSQLFTLTTAHIYEVVKAPYEFRSVEQAISSEPDPSSCSNGRGMLR